MLWKLGWLGICALPLWATGWMDRQIPLGNNRANELFEQKNYQEALKTYLDLYGQDTENGALAYNIGNAYMAIGDLEKASEFYQRAVGSDHQEAKNRARFNMGNLRLNSDQPQAAAKQYVDYLKDRPEDVDAKRNLEIALRKLERQQQQNQDRQNQDQDQDQEQEQQQRQNQDQQDQRQQEDQQDQQPRPDQNERDQNQGRDQRQDQQQEQKEQDRQQPSERQPQEREGELNEAMKEQILDALEEQELKQQKEFQKRKIGRIKRRAKDW